jgi:hypothetical protein
MLSIFAGLAVGVAARCAIVLVVVFVLSSTLPRLPRNRIYLFVSLFVLFVPVNFMIDYADVSFLGYHRMGWTAALLISFVAGGWPTLAGLARVGSGLCSSGAFRTQAHHRPQRSAFLFTFTCYQHRNLLARFAIEMWQTQS